MLPSRGLENQFVGGEIINVIVGAIEKKEIDRNKDWSPSKVDTFPKKVARTVLKLVIESGSDDRMKLLKTRSPIAPREVFGELLGVHTSLPFSTTTHQSRN
ncbi:hypothetical protein [Pseudoruegeria sp. SK021]|uniref:hypothetical protein n=1 Tax=Pseudoruegeria sp. SK021 TaxID=1933035 RepID=UPI000A251855|nr:hypothetical protein [Pseudoruegeria sp. SK021]OSP52932.1 hypothetical protein BV911_18530 [Pseudoruegeria sp. SK021]